MCLSLLAYDPCRLAITPILSSSRVAESEPGRSGAIHRVHVALPSSASRRSMLERAVVAGETSVSSPTIMDRASHGKFRRSPVPARGLPGFARAASLKLGSVQAWGPPCVARKPVNQSLLQSARAEERVPRSPSFEEQSPHRWAHSPCSETTTLETLYAPVTFTLAPTDGRGHGTSTFSMSSLTGFFGCSPGLTSRYAFMAS